MTACPPARPTGDGVKTTGMTSAASALRYWERRQEIVANNLANVNTEGFKAERVFARMMGGALPVPDTATDWRAGSLKPTGAPLDLAVEGNGFFIVDTPAGERLTRGGSFRLDDSGRLVDANGHALLGEDGPISLPLPQGAVEIDAGGVVRVDGKEAGRLRIETTPPNVALAHEGGTLFVPDKTRQPLPTESRTVRQGFLEDSNVNSVSTMVDMISIQRAYAAVQEAVTTLDGIRNTISNQLGKPV
jgi:flagellar basal-body rod protein FlgF